MTQDEIIKMAQDCGFTRTHTGDVKLWLCNKNNLEIFAKLVAAKEREECALICERVYKRMCPEAQENEVGIEAEIIRARGKA
jgi:hypothetical protein